MDGNGTDVIKKKDKTFPTDENPRDIKTKTQLLSDLDKIVKKIDDTYVVWDDHDDIKINAADLKTFRIVPEWENRYKIEMFIRNEDRVLVTGLDWNQVKDFVQNNLDNITKSPTGIEKAYDKSYRNRKDQSDSPDKGIPQKDKFKTLPLTNEPPKTTKNKEKTYTEQEVKKKEDLPDQKMREIEKLKKLIDYKVKDPVKLRKRKPDTKLTIKL